MSSTESDVSIVLTRGELQVLIGGVHEALFELGDDEFHVRTGVPATQAHELMKRLLDVRNAFDNEMSDPSIDSRDPESDG